jgi:hypothetical protein
MNFGRAVGISPPGLIPSEEQWVRDLRAFWEQEKCGLLAGKELFLLRNLGRGKGVGFFEGRGFYPDEKARLHEYLRTLSQQLPPSRCGWTVELDSYLVSATRFEELRVRYDNGTWDKAKFAQHHILFPERNHGYDYLRFILAPPR